MLKRMFGSGAIAGACLMMTNTQAEASALPERVVKAVNASIADGRYQTVVFGVVDGNKTAVEIFGKFDHGKAPNGDTVYEIGSITKTFTATMLAQGVLSKRLTLDTPVSKLLPDFTLPSRDGKQITLGDIGTQHSGLPRMPSNFSPKDSANPMRITTGRNCVPFSRTTNCRAIPGHPTNIQISLLDSSAMHWLSPITRPTAISWRAKSFIRSEWR